MIGNKTNQDVPSNNIAGNEQEYRALQRELLSGGVGFSEIWGVLWGKKWLISATTFLFAAMSVVLSLTLPNEYTAQALLSPSQELQGGGLESMVGQLGGIASLAGLNLDSQAVDKTTVAIEVMRSRKFIDFFITKYDLLVPLMASKGWELETGELIIDEEIYNMAEKKWVREVSPPLKPKPSSWEAYKVFSELLDVSLDKLTGLITVSVEHHSPLIAKQWVDLLVLEVNHVIKSQDVEESQKSIIYLNKQLEKIVSADMRTVFYQLIEEQTKTMMLAEVRDEYVFTTIDPAVIPEEKSGPIRPLICIVGMIFGWVLGVCFVLVHNFLGRGSNLAKESNA